MKWIVYVKPVILVVLLAGLIMLLCWPDPSPSPSPAQDGKRLVAAFELMKAPTVRVLTLFHVWTVEIRPEYRGPYPYLSSRSTAMRLVEISAGQTAIRLSPAKGETFLPHVWVENGEIWCGNPVIGSTRLLKSVAGAESFSNCSSSWRIETLEGQNILKRSSLLDIAAIGGEYILQIEPAQTPSAVRVSYPKFTTLDPGACYDLNTMSPSADMDKVNITVELFGAGGTGLVLPYSGPPARREEVRRLSTGKIWFSREWVDYAYPTQTLLLTNWHVVREVWDDVYYDSHDPDCANALWRFRQVVDAQAFVQLNPASQWLPVGVPVIEPDYDLALLTLSPGLPGVPPLNFLPAGEQPEKGEYAYIVGYPLFIADDTLGEGQICETEHIPAPGEPLWGRRRYLTTIPARGGSSGSGVFVLRDGIPQLIGMLHAGYVSLADTGEFKAEPGEVLVKDRSNYWSWPPVIIPNPSSISLEMIAIPSPYHIIVSIDDISAFLFEAGIELEGLAGRFSWTGP